MVEGLRIGDDAPLGVRCGSGITFGEGEPPGLRGLRSGWAADFGSDAAGGSVAMASKASGAPDGFGLLGMTSGCGASFSA